jgi:pantetheine-phosphate adenylyltransferase
MAGMNQQLDPSVETVFLMADVSLQPIASRLVKEIALFGGDIAPFVSPEVRELIVERVQRLGRRGDY